MPDAQKRVLLFEDDFESMRDLKEQIEETLGWQVALTADKKVLERLSQERFDLIVVDLMIHRKTFDANEREVENVHYDGVSWQKTGLEFLRRLRRGEYSTSSAASTAPDVPVIVLSAVVTLPIKQELRDECYMEKPFRLEQMLDRIRSLLQE